MRVLGIDCGTEYTGYGIVDLLDDERLVCVTCGAIKVSPREPMPTRLSRNSVGLHELISEHRPDRVAIEDVFYAVNVKSALKLGQVRGVAMLGGHRRTGSRRVLAALHQVRCSGIRQG